MDGLLRDVRLGVRAFARSPGLVLATTLTLTVATGAAVAVLTLLDAVVLKPLPVARPRELVLFSDNPTEGEYTGTQSGTWILFSTPSFEYLRAHQRSFQDVCAFQAGRERHAARIDGGSPELVAITHVSGNYFPLLGVAAQAGRTLSPGDDRPGAARVAVLSDAYWSRRFNRDRSVVGRTLTTDRDTATIVGVAAPDFSGETVRTPPDAWMPIAMRPARARGFDDHHTYSFDLMGRLKPDVTMAAAGADVNRLLAAFLLEEAGPAPSAVRRAEIGRTRIALARGDLGRSALRGRAATPLALLATLVVLLVASASTNVGSILLARAAARDGVSAVHLMLGATRERLVRRTIVETLGFVAPGCLAGVASAIAARSMLPRLVAAAALPIDLSLDWRAIAMIAAVTGLCGIVSCAGPVWRAWTVDFAAFQRGSRATARTGRSLVVMQIAAAIPLLFVAGLLLRSTARLEGQELAVDRTHVLLADFGPGFAAQAETRAMRAATLEAVRALPHVVAAAYGSQTPLGGDTHASSLRVEGRPPRDDAAATAAFVGPGYFRALGLPLVAGREFADTDAAAHPRVMLLSETAARVFLPGENPIGRRLAYGSRPPAEVIGIVKDVKLGSMRGPMPRQAYIPQLQEGGYGGRLIVRTDADPQAIAGAIRQAAQGTAPALPLIRTALLDDEIRAATSAEHALALAAAALAGATLLVAATGLAGLMAYLVARQTREFGIRAALGATTARLVRSVIAAAARLATVGAIAGASAAAATTRLVGSLLYDVPAADPIVVAGVATLVGIAAVGASLWPARLAARADPLVALRSE